MGNTSLRTSPDSAMTFYRKAYILARPKMDRKGPGPTFRKYYAASLRGMGNVSFYKGNFDAAIGFYRQSLKESLVVDDHRGVLMCYNNLGLSFWKKGTYDEALNYYLKSLSICDHSGDRASMMAVLNNIGLIQYSIGNADSAKGYYMRSLAIARETMNKQGMSDALNNIGLVTWEKKDYDSAIKCFQRTLDIKRELGDQRGVSSSYTNIGLVLNDKGMHDQAIAYYHNALEEIIPFDDRNEIALIKGNIASAHLSIARKMASSPGRTYQLLLAVRFGKESSEMARAVGSLPLLNASSSTLMEAYKLLGDYREATMYAENYIATRDSMFSNEKTEALAEMTARYEVEKKQLEIDRLMKESELQRRLIQMQEAENTDQRTFLIITFAGIAMVTAFSIVIVFLYSNKKKVNLILQAQKAEIEEKNLTKDKLFSIISHDLRNPFGTILGFSEMLVEESGKIPASSELQRIAGILSDASRQANDLLTSLLEWSLLQTHRLTPNPEPLVMKDLADEIISLFSGAFREKEIGIRNFVAEEDRCFSDREMTRTVLRNIVSNAIKFTRPGGTVTLSSEITGDRVTLLVEDTGIGLSKEQAAELFRLKKNVSTPGTADEKGTGLGLIISKEFIEANKGTFLIESEPGRGTRTSFTLPRA